MKYLSFYSQSVAAEQIPKFLLLFKLIVKKGIEGLTAVCEEICIQVRLTATGLGASWIRLGHPAMLGAVTHEHVPGEGAGHSRPGTLQINRKLQTDFSLA